MITIRPFMPLIALATAMAPMPALANDDGFELWINPSVSHNLDADTAIELETAQRLRSAGDGREDTYFARAWLAQDLADNVTLAGAVERRINDGASNETRLMQQLSTSHGIIRTRLRVEQRFVDGRGGRMGLRIRPRLGLSVPLDEAGRWSAKADAELFLTARATGAGGDTGLTGLRTQIGVSWDVSDTLLISAAYLRQQDFADGAPDVVGHAPLIGVALSF